MQLVCHLGVPAHLAQVELEPIQPDDVSDVALERDDLFEVMSDMLRGDAQRLRVMIERHALYTGSTKARHILDNWIEYLPKFIKIMPVDYRRAVLEIEASAKEPQSLAAAGE